jgi:hypothetical protein
MGDETALVYQAPYPRLPEEPITSNGCCLRVKPASVPEARRSAARRGWWQPTFEVRDRQELMSPIWCHHLELPIGSTYAAGAAVLMAALAYQTSLAWSEAFMMIGS